MRLCPNAKINLGLNVLRRRSDGYHDIDTLLVPCRSLADTLDIEVADRFSIRIIREGRVMDGSAMGDWNPLDDITVKAYRLLKKEFDLPPVSIRLVKGIPSGAGLGGGSADGAFTLVALNEMFDLFMPDPLLEALAAELGSDCPFFIRNSPAFARGRGDELEPFSLPALDDFQIRVSVPDAVRVSTAQAYAAVTPSIPEMTLEEILSLPPERWRDCLRNDFETQVSAAFPQVAELKRRMYADGAVYASMTGSGSAVYGLFRKP